MNKLTNILILIIVSLIAVFTMPLVHVGLHWIADAHQFLLDKLALVFQGGGIGKIVRLSLAIIIIPLFMALIPAFVYWIFRRRWIPHYMAIVWVIWFMLVTLLAYK